MAFPGRYELGKASQDGILASCGKADLCNHDSTSLDAFQDMLSQLALMKKTLFIKVFSYGKMYM